MSQSLQRFVKRGMKVIAFGARTDIFVYCTAWLIVLTIAGTLAQPSIGLYQAQQTYFSSWFFFEWIVPLPGGQLTLTVVFFNLFFFLILKSTLGIKKIGLFITHVGALLLLLGGFFTAQFSEEGNMLIPEGQSRSFFADYHDLELAIVDKGPADHDLVTVFDPLWFQDGNVLTHETLPFKVQINHYYVDCEPIPKKQTEPNYQGLAREYDLVAYAGGSRPDPRSGMTLTISNDQGTETAHVLLLEALSKPEHFDFAGGHYDIELRNRKSKLPFELALIDFRMEHHPGTTMARSYQSEVMLKDGNQERRVVISMNKPLRHRGYTFYQSSYVQNEREEATVLAVVKNSGRQFPYFSSVIMCIGLLLHLIIHLPRHLKDETFGRADA